jgi:hypothetical protein
MHARLPCIIDRFEWKEKPSHDAAFLKFGKSLEEIIQEQLEKTVVDLY